MYDKDVILKDLKRRIRTREYDCFCLCRGDENERCDLANYIVSQLTTSVKYVNYLHHTEPKVGYEMLEIRGKLYLNSTVLIVDIPYVPETFYGSAWSEISTAFHVIDLD